MKQNLINRVSPEVIEPDQLLSMAVRAASEKKGLNLAAIDLRAIASFADYLLICSGASTRQVRAIADAVVEALKLVGLRPRHVEGYKFAHWILLDYGNVVVHLFEESTREFYDLERLWRDGRQIPIDGEGQVQL